MNPERTTAHAKKILRRDLRAALARLDPAHRTVAGAQLCHRVLALRAWCQARLLLLFAPLHDEPDIAPLWQKALADGKTLCLPHFDPHTDRYVARQIHDANQDLVPGHRGILEPRPYCPVVPLNRLDLVLVPGLGFTPDGCRLGRGRAYYDRLLADVPGLKVGVGFDLQLVDTLPAESHDIRLDGVLTPTRQCWVNQGAGVT